MAMSLMDELIPGTTCKTDTEYHCVAFISQEIHKNVYISISEYPSSLDGLTDNTQSSDGLEHDNVNKCQGMQ